jgi:hypothetical protein
VAGNAARRARRLGQEPEPLDGEPFDDAIDGEADDRPSGPSRSARFLAWVDQGNKEGSSYRMQGRDAPGAYAASIVLVVIPFVFIVANATHHGTALPSPIWQAAGLIFGLATAVTVRLANRVVTPLAAVVSVLLTGTGSSAVPKSLQYLTEVDLVVGMAVVVVLTMRQSRARGVQTAERRAAQRPAGRDARSGRGSGAGSTAKRRSGKKAEEPAGPPPSRRYTPPKNRSSA